MFRCIFCILFIGMMAQNSDSVTNSGVIVPIGEIDKKLLEELTTVLSVRFDMPFELEEPCPIPEDTYNSERGQYGSSEVLERLNSYKGKKVLGVIDKDLYTPGLNFVFGQADLPGRSSLISIMRLREEFYGLPKDYKKFFDRITKEAVHELGHTYGLGHCSNPKCVMFFSNSLLDTERKSSSFCGKCQKKFKR